MKEQNLPVFNNCCLILRLNMILLITAFAFVANSTVKLIKSFLSEKNHCLSGFLCFCSDRLKNMENFVFGCALFFSFFSIKN